MEGWVKLHRQLLEWEWYSDSNVFRLFMHLLLKANYKEKKWQGQVVEVGELVTGRDKLAAETGLTEQQVRSILKKLERTGEITLKATNRYTIVKLVKYSNYQGLELAEQPTNNQQITSSQPAVNQQLASNQPTNNQQITTTKEVKKERSKERKKEINKDKDSGAKIAPFDFKNIIASESDDLQKAITEFLEFRKTIKKAMKSEQELTKWLKKLKGLADNDNDRITIIDNSIANGWTGIFALKVQGVTQNGYSSNRDSITHLREVKQENGGGSCNKYATIL